MWGDAVEAADCGDAVALWISRFILRQESGLRLGYYTRNYTPRTTQKFHTVFPITKHDLVNYKLKSVLCTTGTAFFECISLKSWEM